MKLSTLPGPTGETIGMWSLVANCRGGSKDQDGTWTKVRLVLAAEIVRGAEAAKRRPERETILARNSAPRKFPV